MMEHQLLIVSPLLDDSMFRRGLLKSPIWGAEKKKKGKDKGGKEKKGANMLAAAAAHLLVEGDMVTCGYLW